MDHLPVRNLLLPNRKRQWRKFRKQRQSNLTRLQQCEQRHIRPETHFEIVLDPETIRGYLANLRDQNRMPSSELRSLHSDPYSILMSSHATPTSSNHSRVRLLGRLASLARRLRRAHR